MITVFADVSESEPLLARPPSGKGVIDKHLGQEYAVEIAFKNTGTAENMWSVNIDFEAERWSFNGTARTIKLKPDQTKTLVWNGNVPRSAPIDSTVRLVVYYNDSFVPLNWWVHIVSDTEITIISSLLK
jgi:hypothetical protein